MKLSADAGRMAVLTSDTLMLSVESVRIYRGEERRDWASVADTPRVVNIFQHAQGNAITLGDEEFTPLPPANFTQLRVKFVLQDTVLYSRGLKFKVQMPEEFDPIVRVDCAVAITSGSTVEVFLILDLEKSLLLRQERYLFAPVVKAR